tara:strand:+ start:142 stop:336 length:195 start_codon:yes stop_codon:yes gene_type:complete
LVQKALQIGQNILGVIMILISGGLVNIIVMQREQELTYDLGQDLNHLRVMTEEAISKLEWKLVT